MAQTPSIKHFAKSRQIVKRERPANPPSTPRSAGACTGPGFEFDQILTGKHRDSCPSADSTLVTTLGTVSLVSRLVRVAVAVPHTCTAGHILHPRRLFRPVLALALDRWAGAGQRLVREGGLILDRQSTAMCTKQACERQGNRTRGTLPNSALRGHG